MLEKESPPLVKLFYCLWVKTGLEETYISDVQPLLNGTDVPLRGTLYFPKKKMRLKKGTEYCEPLFPGYVFFETTETDPEQLLPLKQGRGFIRFLPQNNQVQPLSASDMSIIESLVRFGSVLPIVHAQFDVNDRIVILDGPFKDLPGKIVAVNRRNKRVNIELEIMNGIRMVGLTYEEVRRDS